MPLPSVLKMVQNRLTFWAAAPDTTVIEEFVLEQKYFLQKYLSLADEQVEDDANYSKLQLILLADLTAFELLKKKAIEGSAGSSSSAEAPTYLKRAKADVVEAEFEQVSSDDSFSQQAGEVLGELKSSICRKASALGLSLPLCARSVEVPALPFKYYPDP